MPVNSTHSVNKTKLMMSSIERNPSNDEPIIGVVMRTNIGDIERTASDFDNNTLPNDLFLVHKLFENSKMADLYFLPKTFNEFKTSVDRMKLGKMRISTYYGKMFINKSYFENLSLEDISKRFEALYFNSTPALKIIRTIGNQHTSDSSGFGILSEDKDPLVDITHSEYIELHNFRIETRYGDLTNSIELVSSLCKIVKEHTVEEISSFTLLDVLTLVSKRIANSFLNRYI